MGASARISPPPGHPYPAKKCLAEPNPAPVLLVISRASRESSARSTDISSSSRTVLTYPLIMRSSSTSSTRLPLDLKCPAIYLPPPSSLVANIADAYYVANHQSSFLYKNVHNWQKSDSRGNLQSAVPILPPPGQVGREKRVALCTTQQTEGTPLPKAWGRGVGVIGAKLNEPSIVFLH